MKKSTQTPQEEFDKLPLLPKEDWRFLWEDDHWDVPLSGMLLHKDEMLYFTLHDEGTYYEDTDTWLPPSYTVHRLKPPILELELKWHNLFIGLVGLHFDYDAEGELIEDFIAKKHPDCESFYKKKEEEYDPIEPDLDDPEVAELIARIQC